MLRYGARLAPVCYAFTEIYVTRGALKFDHYPLGGANIGAVWLLNAESMPPKGHSYYLRGWVIFFNIALEL